jgi:hypothetical protein
VRLSILENVQIIELVRLQAGRYKCAVDGLHVWSFLQLVLCNLQRSLGECRVKAHVADVGEGDARWEEGHKNRRVVELFQWDDANHGDLVNHQSCNDPCVHVWPHSTVALIAWNVNSQNLHWKKGRVNPSCSTATRITKGDNLIEEPPKNL